MGVSDQMRRLPVQQQQQQQQQQQNAQIGQLPKQGVMVSPQSVASQNVEVGPPSGQVKMVPAEIGQPEVVGGALPAQRGLQQTRSESIVMVPQKSLDVQNAQAGPTELGPHQPTMLRSEMDEVTGSPRNRDGDLNSKVIRTGPGKRGSVAFNLFEMVDTDGNGTISRSEFKAALKQGLLKRTWEKHSQDSEKGLTRS